MLKRYRRSTLKRRARKYKRRALVTRYKRQPIAKANFKKTFYSGAWTFGVGTTADFWKYNTFNFADMQNSNEITALFDEYKINAIKVTYRPMYDSVSLDSQSPSNLVQSVGTLHVVVDPKSALAPSGVYNTTTLNAFLEQGNVRSYNLNRPVNIYFKPVIADQVFGGSTASHFIKAPFIRTTETAVSHRGFHAFIHQNAMGTGNTNIRLDTFITYYFTARGIR